MRRIGFVRDVLIDPNAYCPPDEWNDCKSHPNVVHMPCSMARGVDPTVAEQQSVSAAEGDQDETKHRDDDDVQYTTVHGACGRATRAIRGAQRQMLDAIEVARTESKLFSLPQTFPALSFGYASVQRDPASLG